MCSVCYVFVLFQRILPAPSYDMSRTLYEHTWQNVDWIKTIQLKRVTTSSKGINIFFSPFMLSPKANSIERYSSRITFTAICIYFYVLIHSLSSKVIDLLVMPIFFWFFLGKKRETCWMIKQYWVVLHRKSKFISAKVNIQYFL